MYNTCTLHHIQGLKMGVSLTASGWSTLQGGFPSTWKEVFVSQFYPPPSSIQLLCIFPKARARPSFRLWRAVPLRMLFQAPSCTGQQRCFTLPQRASAATSPLSLPLPSPLSLPFPFPSSLLPPFLPPSLSPSLCLLPSLSPFPPPPFLTLMHFHNRGNVRVTGSGGEGEKRAARDLRAGRASATRWQQKNLHVPLKQK